MKSDEAFLDSFNASHTDAWIVAEWLSRKGMRVRIVPSSPRPEFKDRHQYKDEGDIEVTLRIEAKGRSLDFTCADDFPYSTVFVDEVYKVDGRAPNTLHSYVTLSSDKKYTCVIPASSRKHWVIEEKYDKLEGKPIKSYACPKEFCTFHCIRKEDL